MTESKSATCIADVKAVLGEGPVWVPAENALYWVDIKGPRIFRRSLEGVMTSWTPPFRICSLAPRARGGFIAGTERGFAFVDPAAGGYELTGHPEPERTSNRFNDGTLDREGRFWAGTMDDEEAQASGALYRLHPQEGHERVDDGYKVTNGPAFSPSGRIMYHNDSARQVTYSFDIDEAGRATNRRIFASWGEGEGYPDGMTVDAEGCLWIAFWDGWCLRRYSPEGALIGTLDVPVQRPTSCAFGGPALDHLFITSASIGLDADALANQPCAGGLLLARPGVTGLPDKPFGG